MTKVRLLFLTSDRVGACAEIWIHPLPNDLVAVCDVDGDVLRHDRWVVLRADNEGCLVGISRRTELKLC